MRSSKSKPARVAGVLAALALASVGASAGCGGGVGGGGVGGGGDGPLAGVEFTVGSKEFPEQVILGQIAILALENAGADVTDETGIEGTANVRRALDSGEIDMYWEYTGTGWSTILQHEVTDAPSDTQELYEAVAKEDREKNQVFWLDPAPLNNTYAIATTQAKAQELGVQSLSDYAELASKSPEQASLCAANEFLVRPDGLQLLEKAYGLKLPGGAVSEMDLNIIHTRIPKSDPCNFGEVFATDGQIVTNNLTVLEDDKSAFVKYNLAMTIRGDAYNEHKQALDQVFNPIAKQLTDETMQQLNAKVGEGELEEDVAEGFLKDKGLID
ncbi:MAG: glycine/betaine ABC transporter substrate-binding protein [Streptosporangiales bacterium]|nr:glycine/betaine ABC transporter substrate-binding protein [Streptosporangiales bacterium]